MDEITFASVMEHAVIAAAADACKSLLKKNEAARMEEQREEKNRKFRCDVSSQSTAASHRIDDSGKKENLIFRKDEAK